MKTRLLVPFALLWLAGCASWHTVDPAHPPAESRFSASMECGRQFTAEHPGYRTAESFGLIGGIVAASKYGAEQNRFTRACMAQHGWAQNE